MREIVLDTETTGLDPYDGHRVIEIGCVELVNHLPTNNHFHVYINPEREVPDDAIRIHGITNDFLVGKPLFTAVADAFIDFIGDATLVIHNAEFDIKFLNYELEKVKKEPQLVSYFPASKCLFVTFKSEEDAVRARNTLYGLCVPNVGGDEGAPEHFFLNVDFVEIGI